MLCDCVLRLNKLEVGDSGVGGERGKDGKRERKGRDVGEERTEAGVLGRWKSFIKH